jgi:glycosyltransferase involved in cell wall biosynthesis
MKIALVRGPHLNPFEFQAFAPLTRRHAFTIIGGNWQFYRNAIDHNIPIQKASVWGECLGRLDPSLFVFFNRALSWILGRSYGIYDLASRVGDADILHSPETFSTLTYECLQIRRRPAKVVASVWENLPHMGETHPIRRKRKERALRELDGFLAVTDTTRRMLIEEGVSSDRIEVIPMGIDLSRFNPAPRDPGWAARLNLEPNEKVVLFVGRWVPEKGVVGLLDAVPPVLKATSGRVRFCFVGAGPLAPLLKAAVKTYPGRIQLVPFVSYDQLPALHNLADVFVLPSKPAPKWEEQYGYVLVESMACGKAIITTRSGSIPDVIDQAGVLVPPGDASALASALIRLLASDKERAQLGAAGRARALSCFDAEKNAPQIEAFYKRVLAKSS